MSVAHRFVEHFYGRYPGRVPLPVAFGMGLQEILPFVYEDDEGYAVGLAALGVVATERVPDEVVQIFHMSVFLARQGTGTQMLRELCAEADQRGVILTGTPMFMTNGEDPRMDDEALADWYRRHGFVGETWLHRPPQNAK